MAETRGNLDKNQKLALAGLAVFTVCVITVWFLKIGSEIKGPLHIAPPVKNAIVATIQTADDKLKSQDTDGDGLSDWDELNIYHTSPYLADTDSDGIPDGVEIKNGTDPNCPTGKVCKAVIPTASQTATDSATVASLATSGASADTSSASSTDLSNLLLTGQLDAASLRQVLINSGQVNKADLDKISDADLLQAYKDQLTTSSTQ
jgi:hypothetical protein